ncbi:hypothetical protein AG1IA_09561 [Rhizoctonia solani AG-1 IA]|uniref:Uncharacterized protein n=1 Tax=Thanatephorus cucumeris (strain AG1-IA) TaxID=983506 RepID=L8WJ72_THACA|nr:hypothetical protein AG1IA_09561 [Rhizoctonia solani AG-1 IA]
MGTEGQSECLLKDGHGETHVLRRSREYWITVFPGKVAAQNERGLLQRRLGLLAPISLTCPPRWFRQRLHGSDS